MLGVTSVAVVPILWFSMFELKPFAWKKYFQVAFTVRVSQQKYSGRKRNVLNVSSERILHANFKTSKTNNNKNTTQRKKTQVLVSKLHYALHKLLIIVTKTQAQTYWISKHWVNAKFVLHHGPVHLFTMNIIIFLRKNSEGEVGCADPVSKSLVCNSKITPTTQCFRETRFFLIMFKTCWVCKVFISWMFVDLHKLIKAVTDFRFAYLTLRALIFF